MTEGASIPKTVALASFYRRLEPLEAIISVVIGQAEISALLTFRGDPEKKILMDFSGKPARITADAAAKSAHIYVTIPADELHDILIEKIKPGVAIGRRRMLLRGSPGNLAKFIPLFDFGPMLYREHLEDIGRHGAAGRPAAAPVREAVMNGQIFEGKPIPVLIISAPERILFGFINLIGYAVGWSVGFMRYRIFKNLSVFDVLTSMSNGLKAATPENKGISDK